MLKTAGFIVVCAAAVAARPSIVSQDRATFTAETQLVVLHVTVTDRSGAYVGGLDVDAFRVLEDGKGQPVQFFAAEDAPVTIGLVLDSSGSMRRMRERVIDAAGAFAGTCNAGDEVFALTFSDEVHDVLPGSAAFTSDARELRAGLLSEYAPSGRTALYDAIAGGIQQLSKGTRDRRVLAVLSDGGDNASHVQFPDVLARVQSSNVTIYTIAIVDPDEPDANPGRLRELANTSGGLAFSPRDSAGVEGAFSEISRDIRHGYTIGYVSTNAGGSIAGLRRLAVAARAPDGRALRVRARRAYLANDAGAVIRAR